MSNGITTRNRTLEKSFPCFSMFFFVFWSDGYYCYAIIHRYTMRAWSSTRRHFLSISNQMRSSKFWFFIVFWFNFIFDWSIYFWLAHENDSYFFLSSWVCFSHFLMLSTDSFLDIVLTLERWYGVLLYIQLVIYPNKKTSFTTINCAQRNGSKKTNAITTTLQNFYDFL